jgi:undecaprenyl diphosphate synthase
MVASFSFVANHPTRPTGRWPAGIDPARIPRHVAVIMDGNGRWAEQRGLSRTEGHTASETSLVATIRAALAINVSWLTVFAFSTENWARPGDEVNVVVDLNHAVILRHRDEFNELGVRCRFIGRRLGKTPARIRSMFEETEEMTGSNTALNFVVAFNYGGRAEIADAARSIAADVEVGTLAAADVSERTVRDHLYLPSLPDVDLLIRTSGEYRISNFLLWQLAYSELVFPGVLWPDFRAKHFYAAVRKYQTRERRFGGLQEE